jgi:hypothetical protein
LGTTGKKDIQSKIDNGEYKLTNLNWGHGHVVENSQ